MRFDDRQERQRLTVIDQREHRVQVHVGALRRQINQDQVAERRFMCPQVVGQYLDATTVGALTDPHQECVPTGDQNIAALELRRMQMISEVGVEHNTTTIILMPSDFVTLAKTLTDKFGAKEQQP